MVNKDYIFSKSFFFIFIDTPAYIYLYTDI